MANAVNYWFQKYLAEKKKVVELEEQVKNAEDHAYFAGSEAMREQIMKDAITADIGYYNQHGLSLYPEKSLERLGFNERDKVKVIIIKGE